MKPLKIISYQTKMVCSGAKQWQKKQKYNENKTLKNYDVKQNGRPQENSDQIKQKNYKQQKFILQNKRKKKFVKTKKEKKK